MIRVIKNQHGMLTVEFIFGFFMVVGIITLLFRLSYTFVVVEVTQYIMFATSRAYSAAHVSEERQYEVAKLKYEQLALQNPVFSTLYKTGWYTVPAEPTIGHFSSGATVRPQGPDYGEDAGKYGGVTPFVGARIDFTAPVITLEIPFVGKPTDDDLPFTAGIASFLMREPTLTECQAFLGEPRSAAIQNLSGFSSLSNVNMSKYVAIEDNGC